MTTIRLASPWNRSRHLGAAVVLCAAVACAPAMRRTTSAPVSEAELAQLWSEPSDLASRDLLAGRAAKTARRSIQGKLKIKSFDPSRQQRRLRRDRRRGP